MSEKLKQNIRKEFDRLKKGMERLIKPRKEQPQPQLVLQPYRNKKIF
jgi:hypothetical protein